MAVRPIDGDALKNRIRHMPRTVNPDLVQYALVQAIIADMPTLTTPNEPQPVLVNDEPDREYIDYICPRCKDIISQRRRDQRMETIYQCKYHDNCGQRVDWSNLPPDRRPPEGESDA